jgi:hypothetical protein
VVRLGQYSSLEEEVSTAEVWAFAGVIRQVVASAEVCLYELEALIVRVAQLI